MSLTSAEFNAVTDWAERACALMHAAVTTMTLFEGMLLECKNPNKTEGSHRLIGMADSPENLQSAVIELFKHSHACPDALGDVAQILKEEVPESLSPIKCPEYYVLTALEACQAWSSELANEMQAPLLWTADADNLFEVKAPNWASETLTNDEFNDYAKYLKLTRRKLRFANSNRIQWLSASVEREKLILENLGIVGSELGD